MTAVDSEDDEPAVKEPVSAVPSSAAQAEEEHWSDIEFDIRLANETHRDVRNFSRQGDSHFYFLLFYPHNEENGRNTA